MILEKINKPNDIKRLSHKELELLSGEIRHFLIENISNTGGHLASNLGTVELTMALHLVCDFPEDKVVWDVGHQSYTHKILTGRKDQFKGLRQLDCMSGFPKRSESDCDCFDTGHSSNSISAAVGYARARDLMGKKNKVVAVIGDGAMTGGMAFEGLNNAGEYKKSNMLIVLNDNEMSISANVGGLSKGLTKMRTSEGYVGLKDEIYESLKVLPKGEKVVKTIRRTKSGIKSLVIPGMMFEDLGIMYLGPVDGHDVNAMVEMFNYAFGFNGPVLVHVVTKKGKGYEPAENHPSRFHGTDAFDIETGLPKNSKKVGYTDVFSTVMVKMGERNPKLVGITAAMAEGTGLKRFRNIYPERFFDVGIAEEHAVTFAAAMALSGFKPVFAVYSSFLQRGYDQIIHDVCMQNAPVVFAIDRAGLVGSDGETHQGVFDISYMCSVPGMTVMAPKNKWELSDMLKFAIDYDAPISLRYPRGEACCQMEEFRAPIELGKCEPIITGGKVLIFAIGSMVSSGKEVVDILAKEGIEASLTNARFAKPLDTAYLSNEAKEYDLVVTMEENVISGGFGENVMKTLIDNGYMGKIMNVAIPDEFIPHGKVPQLLERLGMNPEAIADRIKEQIG